MAASPRKLTERTIRRWVNEASFHRGEQYFRDGMIVHTRRTGSSLKADSHGSSGNLCRVWATVENGNIVNADCSCPVGNGGHCKHAAALLLTWLDRPEEFQEVEDANTAIERRSKEELVALVKQMLLRALDLETLLEVPLPTGQKSRQRVDPEIFRRQVATAFRGYDYEYGVADAIAEQVSATLEIGNGFLAQGDVMSAEAVYEAVANEVLERYEEFEDESGDLGGVVQDAAAGLGRCLGADAEHADAELRGRVLQTLFEIYRFDLDSGGIGLGDDVPDLIVKHASSTEKERVAEWARAAIKKRSGTDWSSKWHREVYGGFLLRLQAEELGNEAYLRVCREIHRLNDLVERLLKLGRVDEASQEAAHADDYELLELAALLVRRKQPEIAERLMRERAKTTKDTRILEWLRDRSRKKGDLAGALEWTRKLFDASPSLDQYRAIKKMAEPLGL